MLHPTTRAATPTRPPTNLARPTAAPVTGEGLRVLVTDTPAHVAGHACTPAMAAWLIATGAAVALVDETGPDRRQWLHLPATPERDDSDGQDPEVAAVDDELVRELYAERFTGPPRTPGTSRAAARARR